jgi:flavin reductase (DIM6/NTAB) family NADH-FMN oxidoreductase RutF
MGYPETKAGTMRLDPENRPDDVYRTLSSLVVPRPIGWISTVDADGVDNLAPFSYFNAVCNRPPVVLFSAGSRDGRPKDTARKALETGEFVANLVTEDVLAPMDRTSEPVEDSEFDFAGLERAPAETVAPPRVAEATATMECEVVEHTTFGDHTVVFGEVLLFDIDERHLDGEDVDAAEVDAVARCGGPYYSGVDFFDFHRGDG